MPNLSKKQALIFDMGLFTEVAVRFARDFGSVKYFNPNYESFPKPFKEKTGEGLEGVERIGEVEFWDSLDKADIIMFPDNTCAGIVEYLKRYEYPVCGVGYAEKLEINRWYGRTVQKDNGLPIQETHKITGMKALEEFCKTHKNYFIKMDNSFRGVSESFHHKNWKYSEPRIDSISQKITPYKEDVVFICEEKLGGIETGYDSIVFDGEQLFPMTGGYERKGVGYIARIYDKEADLPDAFKTIHSGLEPEFKKCKTRFFYSTEIKIDKDRVPYLIDPTLRCAAPGVNAIQLELISNYSEVCYGLAVGIKVNPIMKHKYAAAMALESSEAKDGWLNVTFPKEMRQWVKLRMAINHGGDYYAVPGFDSICSVVALGDSIKDVVNTVKERVKEIHATGIEADVGDFEAIIDDVNLGKQYGISF